jgi:hypothetical protein
MRIPGEAIVGFIPCPKGKKIKITEFNCPSIWTEMILWAKTIGAHAGWGKRMG